MMQNNVIGVLASGRGSNLQAIIEAINKGLLNVEIGVVISDKPNAKALDIATENNIIAICVDRKECSNQQEFEEKIVVALKKHNVSLVVLAGFMRILSPYFIQEFKEKIINIHPSLLPSFPGKNAHEQVISYGAKVSGCTIHFVDEGMDSGPIILQESIPVLDNDTEDSLAKRILYLEHTLYPKAISLVMENKLKIIGRKVIIKE